MPQEPTHQHYRNPLKGGWYYVDYGDKTDPVTGLMTKRCARRYIRDLKRNSGGQYTYGMMVQRRSDRPSNFFLKIFTRPKISG